MKTIITTIAKLIALETFDTYENIEDEVRVEFTRTRLGFTCVYIDTDSGLVIDSKSWGTDKAKAKAYYTELVANLSIEYSS